MRKSPELQMIRLRKTINGKNSIYAVHIMHRVVYCNREKKTFLQRKWWFPLLLVNLIKLDQHAQHKAHWTNIKNKYIDDGRVCFVRSMICNIRLMCIDDNKIVIYLNTSVVVCCVYRTLYIIHMTNIAAHIDSYTCNNECVDRVSTYATQSQHWLRL